MFLKKNFMHLILTISLFIICGNAKSSDLIDFYGKAEYQYFAFPWRYSDKTGIFEIIKRDPKEVYEHFMLEKYKVFGIGALMFAGSAIFWQIIKKIWLSYTKQVQNETMNKLKKTGYFTALGVLSLITSYAAFMGFLGIFLIPVNAKAQSYAKNALEIAK